MLCLATKLQIFVRYQDLTTLASVSPSESCIKFDSLFVILENIAVGWGKDRRSMGEQGRCICLDWDPSQGWSISCLWATMCIASGKLKDTKEVYLTVVSQASVLISSKYHSALKSSVRIISHCSAAAIRSDAWRRKVLTNITFLFHTCFRVQFVLSMQLAIVTLKFLRLAWFR